MFNKGIGIIRGRIIRKFPYLDKTFKFSCFVSVHPKATQNNIRQNILHCTTGEDDSRIPAVFVNEKNELEITMQSLKFTSKDALKTKRLESRLEVELLQIQQKQKVWRHIQ